MTPKNLLTTKALKEGLHRFSFHQREQLRLLLVKWRCPSCKSFYTTMISDSKHKEERICQVVGCKKTYEFLKGFGKNKSNE